MLFKFKLKVKKKNLVKKTLYQSFVKSVNMLDKECELSQAIFGNDVELKWSDFFKTLISIMPTMNNVEAEHILHYILIDADNCVTKTMFKRVLDWMGPTSSNWVEKIIELRPFIQRNFFAMITSQEAEERLALAVREKGPLNDIGLFLIRLSTSTPGYYVLTYTKEKKPKIPEEPDTNKKRKFSEQMKKIKYEHIQIYFDEHKQIRMKFDDQHIIYKDLQDFVQQHREILKEECQRKAPAPKPKTPKKVKLLPKKPAGMNITVPILANMLGNINNVIPIQPHILPTSSA